MRRIVLTYIFLSVIGIWGAMAQNTLNPMNNRDRFGNQIDPNTQPDNLEDSTNTEIQSLPPKLYMWKLSETLGNRTIIPADTASLNFQSTNLVEGMFGHYNYLGNLGSPRLSRLFFEREESEPTIFMAPFSSFFIRPDQVLFTNSNVPYTNLTYYKAGNKVNGEERFKSYFSVNVNKQLAFGFNIDYLYGRGYYQNQSTSHFNAGLFGSYIGEKYQVQAVYNNFFLKMNENGGIADDQYITRPENMSGGKKEYESTTIPVKLEQSSNRNKDFYIYLTQRYRLGFTRRVRNTQEGKPAVSAPKASSSPSSEAEISASNNDIALPNDSIASKSVSTLAAANDSLPSVSTADNDSLFEEEFVPVTSFIHTLKVERSRHQFRSGSEPEGFFPEEYKLYKNYSNDSTTAFSVKNVFGIALLEGFNKYAKAGLTAYISHKFSRYDLMNTDTLTDMRRIRYTEQEIFLGGELAKREGKLLHYNVNGEVGLVDKAIGQFRVNANLDLNFRLWKDTVNFYARGYVSNTLPSFYMRHYHSNHYNWDNDNMDKEFRTRVEGELNISHWGTNLRAGVENIKNYTYFNQSALPEQNGGNIQVLSATLKQDFRLGVFHLDNEVTWQKTSNETVLPLPQLSLYHNFYILAKLAKKVLTVQLGADVRYFTKYNAPAYAPGVQQFHLQPTDDLVEIGGYPIVNVYANLHLKRTRIFAMMYHVNAGMGSANSFLVPHYPINPRLFKIGVSWNFYD
ncbi:MAG: putative porin [Bacteroides sp.]|uniref:putative porin n=1 Tax=Bacteroides sp. TaxID=29523 RepID=UPI0026E00CA2|nr:putative porin [Bacteroides sp.]MDO5419318.1 putative porin [Bacteroides sp.]